MKKLLTLSLVSMTAAVALVSSQAKASTITCVYTEPFLVVTYDSAARTLTTTDDGTQNQTIVENVSFIPLEGTKSQLVDADGVILETFDRNEQGSDGMSDRVYAIDSRLIRPATSPGQNPLWGGCDEQN